MKEVAVSLEVSYLVHSTEDCNTIAEGVFRTLGVGVEPAEANLEGHFGNPITKVEYHVDDKDASAALARVGNLIPSSMQESLRRDITAYMDQHSTLFLRFDKQGIVEGRLEEGGAEVVRVKVRPKGFLPRGSAMELYSGILAGPRS